MTRIGPVTMKVFRVAERRQRAFERAVTCGGDVAPRARALWWLVAWSRKLSNVEVAAVHTAAPRLLRSIGHG